MPPGPRHGAGRKCVALVRTLLAYWLIVGPRNTARPEVQAFCDWLKTPAAQTCAAIGETQTAPPAAA